MYRWYPNHNGYFRVLNNRTICISLSKETKSPWIDLTHPFKSQSMRRNGCVRVTYKILYVDISPDLFSLHAQQHLLQFHFICTIHHHRPGCAKTIKPHRSPLPVGLVCFHLALLLTNLLVTKRTHNGGKPSRTATDPRRVSNETVPVLMRPTTICIAPTSKQQKLKGKSTVLISTLSFSLSLFFAEKSASNKELGPTRGRRELRKSCYYVWGVQYTKWLQALVTLPRGSSKNRFVPPT